MSQLEYRSARRSSVAESESKYWIIPLVLIGIGFVCYLMTGFINDGPEGAAVIGIASIIMGVVQTILLLIAAFVTSMVFKIGFDDVRWATLRLATASIFSGGVSALVPIPFLGLVLFLCILAWLADLEFWEVCVLTFVYFLVSILAGAMLVGLLASL